MKRKKYPKRTPRVDGRDWTYTVPYTPERMPQQCRRLLCVPNHWREEMGGYLVRAMLDLAECMRTGSPPLSPSQFALVRDYLAYFVGSSAWLSVDGVEWSLDDLRQRLPRLNTVRGLMHWLKDLREHGIDPF